MYSWGRRCPVSSPEPLPGRGCSQSCSCVLPGPGFPGAFRLELGQGSQRGSPCAPRADDTCTAPESPPDPLVPWQRAGCPEHGFIPLSPASLPQHFCLWVLPAASPPCQPSPEPPALRSLIMFHPAAAPWLCTEGCHCQPQGSVTTATRGRGHLLSGSCHLVLSKALSRAGVLSKALSRAGGWGPVAAPALHPQHAFPQIAFGSCSEITPPRGKVQGCSQQWPREILLGSVSPRAGAVRAWGWAGMLCLPVLPCGWKGGEGSLLLCPPARAGGWVRGSLGYVTAGGRAHHVLQLAPAAGERRVMAGAAAPRQSLIRGTKREAGDWLLLYVTEEEWRHQDCFFFSPLHFNSLAISVQK